MTSRGAEKRVFDAIAILGISAAVEGFILRNAQTDRTVSEPPQVVQSAKEPIRISAATKAQDDSEGEQLSSERLRGVCEYADGDTGRTEWNATIESVAQVMPLPARGMVAKQLGERAAIRP